METNDKLTINYHIFEAYVKGETIEYRGPYIEDWSVVAPYKEPNDVYRIGNPNYEFRIQKPKVYEYQWSYIIYGEGGMRSGYYASERELSDAIAGEFDVAFPIQSTQKERS